MKSEKVYLRRSSPFRPNNIGLSCVKLENVTHTKEYGTVLTVSGIDMKNGTPIYDIKPYIAYADCKPDAKSSFADIHKNDKLTVKINDELKVQIPNNKLGALIGILECDPRPAYQNDESRIYGISFANMNIKFKVSNRILTVTDIEK